MLVNIWRYSHFTLAVSSCLFILLAAITGIILSFEPIDNKLKPYYIKGSENLSLAKVVTTLQEKYDEVLSLEVDANGFVSTSVISLDDDPDGAFYINPKTGEKIGELITQKPLYAFSKNLHRSLFLKTPGRIFVGVASFLLCLIAITGSILIIKRQKGFRHFFSKIIKEDFAQYWHVVLGRFFLIPIFIIAISGVYLSLVRFEIIPEIQQQSSIDFESINESENILLPSEFSVFRETTLKEIRKLEFPFSPDVTDFFILSRKDSELRINQQNGEIVEQLNFPFINRFSNLNFDLHTGTGSILWSIILLIASINILFFLYSGAMISYKRLKNKIRNQYSPQEAEFIVLVGSENGSTRRFASILQNELIKLKQSVFVDDLNHVQAYPKMNHLVVFTSTYGEGDPPSNANEFLHNLNGQIKTNSFDFSVVGFGSLAYENFCQFAVEVYEKLNIPGSDNLLGEPFLIHNQSYTSFQKWGEKWGESLGFHLQIPPEKKNKNVKLKNFQVVNKKIVNDGYDLTFTLELQPQKGTIFQSGDLLAVYPVQDPVKREYSIGKTKTGNILLSIKKHDSGICSNYLYQLEIGSVLKAELIKNSEFHLPQNEKPIIFIANGTGLAPFLGMIHESRSKTYMFWGGRTEQSYSLYNEYFEEAKLNGNLRAVRIAFSKQNSTPTYVQHLIEQDESYIFEMLQNGATIMICGSVSMQNGVIDMLESICEKHEVTLNKYQNKGQILMDCY